MANKATYTSSSTRGWFFQAGQAHFYLDTCLSLCNETIIEHADLKYLEDSEHADTDNCPACMELRNELAKE